MSTQIPFPNKRLAQAGIGNPLFVTDIENATEDLLEALATLYGFASNGFAILSGFDYGAGAYTGGIVYMNGVFYRCVAGLTENQYLTPDVQDVDNKIYSDANTYPTYRIYQAVAAGAQWGGMPQFVGNMNAYRVSIKKVYDLAIQVVNATESVRGIVELATAAEVLAGTDTERAVTPAGLEGKTATDARKGIIELATSAETQTGTDAERAVTPAGLTARTATDTRTGVIEIATNAEVQAGTDAERAVTPAGLAAKVGETLLRKVVEIGEFNMYVTGGATGYKAINLGIDISKLRSIDVIVRSNDDTQRLPLNFSVNHSGGASGAWQYFGGNFYLNAFAGGKFDSTSFDILNAPSNWNRGWITIHYLP